MGADLRLIFKVTPDDVPTRRMEMISRDAMYLVGELWEQRYKPLHFGPGASAKYRYRQRSREYQDRKYRKFGHREVMVWSGLTKASVLQKLYPRAYPTRVRVDLPTPSYIRMVPRGGKPALGDELTRTNYGEDKYLEKVWGEKCEADMQEWIDKRWKRAK